jgi:hypothetical protein
MGDSPGQAMAAEQGLEPGSRVEVRRRFDQSWARGFEIAEVLAEGFRIRRRSDGSVLPSDFHREEVRPERRRQGLWWY